MFVIHSLTLSVPPLRRDPNPLRGAHCPHIIGQRCVEYKVLECQMVCMLCDSKLWGGVGDAMVGLTFVSMFYLMNVEVAGWSPVWGSK